MAHLELPTTLTAEVGWTWRDEESPQPGQLVPAVHLSFGNAAVKTWVLSDEDRQRHDAGVFNVDEFVASKLAALFGEG